jgi:hypothetical protein
MKLWFWLQTSFASLLLEQSTLHWYSLHTPKGMVSGGWGGGTPLRQSNLIYSQIGPVMVSLWQHWASFIHPASHWSAPWRQRRPLEDWRRGRGGGGGGVNQRPDRIFTTMLLARATHNNNNNDNNNPGNRNVYTVAMGMNTVSSWQLIRMNEIIPWWQLCWSEIMRQEIMFCIQ